MSRSLRSLVLTVSLPIFLLAACKSTPPASYEQGVVASSQRTASQKAASQQQVAASRRAEEPLRDGFGNYSDAAAERLLDEKIAAELAREIQQHDEELRRLELEAEAQRAAAERAAAERRVAYRRYGRYGRTRYGDYRRRQSFVPLNTLFYGGLGAIIGNQSGHRDRGLAIGAGFGLLQDVLNMRW